MGLIKKYWLLSTAIKYSLNQDQTANIKMIRNNLVKIDTSRYKSFSKVALVRANVVFRRYLIGIMILCVVLLFLPWTQNVSTKGLVTTLTPEERPQTIHTVIAGQIDKWYVREGQLVKKGDTIVTITEVKTEYFDTALLPRTQDQINAKSRSGQGYAQKADALQAQIGQIQLELRFKQDQLRNKISQAKLKVEANQNKSAATELDYKNEVIQLARTEQLFKEGLTSLTAVENKRIKVQQTQAKQVELQNEYQQSLQELDNLAFQLQGVDSEYKGKIAKTESERFSTLSEQQAALGEVSKLQNQYSNYAARSSFYCILAPRDCYITSAIVSGLGETVKEGDPIVHIVPETMNLAVEMYIEPIDLPLISTGKQVRFVFDGWPAFIFSGWPNATIGTYSGRVFAIDNVANEKNKIRILVQPDPGSPAWPKALRPGSGAKGFTLLSDVPIWYELWRQLNGFPPEYYTEAAEQRTKIEKSKK
jgi:membrane fusion protein, adhesin transport system